MKKNYFSKRFIAFASLLMPLAGSVQAQSINTPRRQLTTVPSGLPASGEWDGYLRQGADQEAPAARGLTLEQLLQMARRNNPTLGQAQAGIRAAAGRTLQAGLWPNPTVGYVGDEIRGGSFGGGEEGVFIEQNVILGGKLGLDRKILGEERKQAEAEADEQRLRVENGVRISFYQSLAAQQMVQIRTKLNEEAQDAVETTEQLFNVGQADQPDVLQAQVEADEAELALVAAQQDQQRAWRALAALVGTPTMPLARLAGNLEDLPNIDSDQMVSAILRDSPVVRIAQLGVTRADAALARAKREIIPDLSLRAGVLNDFEALDTAASPLKVVGPIGFAEVGVNLRLFNRNQGNVQAAQADLDRANLEVQRVSLVLRQMAAPVLQNYNSSRAVADRYKASTLPKAQRAYELYVHKYREGGAAYPQVLIAQRTLFDLQSRYISVLANVWMNAITLQGLLLTEGLDLPAGPEEIDRPVREIHMPVADAPGARR
jgi:outer membrane protein, heavy metal efflux system